MWKLLVTVINKNLYVFPAQCVGIKIVLKKKDD
jgi:hypothetical protein